MNMKKHLFMKHYCIAGLALLIAAVPTDAIAQVSNNNEDGVYKVERPGTNDFVSGQVLFKLKDGQHANVHRAAGRVQSAGISTLDAVLKEYGVLEMEQLMPEAKVTGTPRRAKAFNGDVIVERDLTQLYRIILPEEKTDQTFEMIEQLNRLDEVEYAEPNYKMYIMADDNIAADYSSNPMVGQQWYLDAYGVKDLWNKPIINKTRPIIAIIDTGVDITHPDLKDNIWTNTAEMNGYSNSDDDRNGVRDDLHGWDFVNNSPNLRDNDKHGTHVAGIAAATNNGIGIVGANPQALIMPVTVMQSDGTGDVATIVKGIDYAVKSGATVLNLSLGSGANSSTMRQALERAYQSAVIVAAAGNAKRCIYTSHWKRHAVGASFPAAYSFVLGVQATTPGGGLASFSNFDDDGPLTSCEVTANDPDGFNYELKAPGTKILSCIPGGRYEVLQGTSMAAPLVAGAISALQMVKQYDNQEALWADLLHSNTIAEAYNLTNRQADLDILRITLRDRNEQAKYNEDEKTYLKYYEVNVGETLNIYPVIRNSFGKATNIKLQINVPAEVEVLKDEVDFGFTLDALGNMTSKNPLIIKVPNDMPNASEIPVTIKATCNESTETESATFNLRVCNTFTLKGLLTEDMTLTPDHSYYVISNFGVNEGVTLTVKPGTRIEFAQNTGLYAFGKLVMNGTQEQPIIMTAHNQGERWAGVFSHPNRNQRTYYSPKIYTNSDNTLFTMLPTETTPNALSGTSKQLYYGDGDIVPRTLNITDYLDDWNPDMTGREALLTDPNYLTPAVLRMLADWNSFLTTCSTSYSTDKPNRAFVSITFLPNWNIYYDTTDIISYCQMDGIGYSYGQMSGTSPIYRDCIKTEYVSTYSNETWTTIYGKGQSVSADNDFNISPAGLPQEPMRLAHGYIWSVKVNDVDLQYDQDNIAELGLGKNKFEVYYNRPMNKDVIPQISFGVISPYNQHPVIEDGLWNADGTIYTAYATIDLTTRSDGENRIYIRGGEDDEHFPCPGDASRFNIMVQAVNSMASGFQAEDGLGCVRLTWNNEENDFEDAMGFNVYRYTEEDAEHPIRLNDDILDITATSYIDDNVTPGQTYYYYYKVLSTDLQEYDISNIVAATPRTATRGDANGSGSVDIADVITTVNYITGLPPKPFVFDAADMNSDKLIDIFDVVGIVRGILNPELLATASVDDGTATYFIKDGTLYIDSPVSLAGIQIQLAVNEGQEVTVADDLKGFEQASSWLSDTDYLFLAYSLSGKKLETGKHALLHIGNAELTSIRLSDTSGKNVVIGNDSTTGIDRMGKHVMHVNGIYDLYGRKLSTATLLKRGVYIINGKKVVK